MIQQKKSETRLVARLKKKQDMRSKGKLHQLYKSEAQVGEYMTQLRSRKWESYELIQFGQTKPHFSLSTLIDKIVIQLMDNSPE